MEIIMENKDDNKITGKEYPLLKIFSSDFEYHIPAYQRPYSWTIEETGVLFDDLASFFHSKEATNDNYFLGSVVLIKKETARYADVIDGQQRLTTLSILYAAMSDVFTDPELKASCEQKLQEKGDRTAGIKAHPRLFLREWDNQFFNQYIQNVRLDALEDIDPATLDTEAKRNIQANCKLLRKRLRETFSSDDELLNFSIFLNTRCYLVSVSTPNQDSAFRVFSVMNSRGLDLLPTDIIKSETIGIIPAEKQADYTEAWEEMENRATREGFNEVFTHTRMIFAKERPKKNLLDEFRYFVSEKNEPEVLIDSILKPYTEAFVQLRECRYTSTHDADKINDYLYWLNKTNNYDWMPPAIKFFAEHSNDSAYILWFVRKLERLASYLLATSQDVNKRMDRYKWILVEMEARPSHSLSDPLRNIELTEWEKQQFLNALNGEIYLMPSLRRNYIIQRLDSFKTDGGAKYDTKVFTIEHVLPQNPASDSEWMRLWPDSEQRTYWLNRIANLVPLTRNRNSSAQNYDFSLKKVKYFKTNGVSVYNLTTEVNSTDLWTPEVVACRQQTLLETCREKWGLYAEPGETDDTTFVLAGRGASATGYLGESESFTVAKGSYIAPDVTEGIQQSYKDLRIELIRNGVILNRCFMKDYTFSSVSAAAAVLLGRSANGRLEWTKLDGRTFAQVNR